MIDEDTVIGRGCREDDYEHGCCFPVVRLSDLEPEYQTALLFHEQQQARITELEAQLEQERKDWRGASFYDKWRDAEERLAKAEAALEAADNIASCWPDDLRDRDFDVYLERREAMK